MENYNLTLELDQRLGLVPSSSPIPIFRTTGIYDNDNGHGDNFSSSPIAPCPSFHPPSYMWGFSSAMGVVGLAHLGSKTQPNSILLVFLLKETL